MNNRQKLILQTELSNEHKTISELRQIYEQALIDCNTKIRELSMRTDMQNLQSIVYQKQYQEAIKGQLEGILTQLHSNEYATVSEYLNQCYFDGFVGNMYDLAGQGIPLIVPINQNQVTKAIQIDSKLSKTLYASLGEDVNYLKKAVRAQVSRGIANGSTWNEIAQELVNNMKSTPFEKAINNAIRIARTEGHRVQTSAKMDAMNAAKDKGADIVKQWDSTLDGRTRETHRKLDGQIRELDEDFEVYGMKASAPSHFGDPAEDCNCRCAVLQRAKWALDQDELDTLKERAAAFGLDKEEEFDDFKEKYLKASQGDEKGADSGSVRSNEQKINGKVTDLDKYEVDGTTYEVDGKHVLLDHKPHEKEIASIIAQSLGKSVEMVPRVVQPKGISTPDYIIDNKKYDLKEPIGSGKHVLYNMINKKKNQANNFIFDISKCPLDYDSINKQISEIYSSTHTKFVNEIIVIKDGEIIKIYNRTK